MNEAEVISEEIIVQYLFNFAKHQATFKNPFKSEARSILENHTSSYYSKTTKNQRQGKYLKTAVK